MEAPGAVGDGAELMRERPALLNLGYRLLGSLAEAEDVVQESFARWYALSPEQRDAITSPGAWLTTVAGRICLDLLRSARVRRERYVGEWVPEPVPGADWIHAGATSDPAERVTLEESVTMAFLVVLDAMTPAERVSFVLHDVFRYPFDQVAEVVGRTPGACRQLASSARRRLDAATPPPTPTARQAAVVRRFREAWATQDIGSLVGLLDPDVVAVADGGGVVPAAAEPLVGAEPVARHYLALAAQAPDDVTLEECQVNGRPGLEMRHRGVTATVFAFEQSGDRITRIWAVRNPDKLRAWHTG